jgi:hypothetical protein
VIINGLADSPSHKQWEVLFNQVNFQARQPETLRAVIERILPPIAAPTITLQPQSQTIVAGGTVTLTVSADGSAPLSYQWQKNGSAIPNATGASLVLPKVTLKEAGDYSVVVTSSGKSVASQAGTVKVVEPVRPVLSGSRRADGGGFEFVLTGETGRNYHIEFSTDLKSWKRVATITPGEQKAVYRNPDPTAALQGFYRAVSE